MEKALSGWLTALVPVPVKNDSAGHARPKAPVFGGDQPNSDLALRLHQAQQRPRHTPHIHNYQVDLQSCRFSYVLCRCPQPSKHDATCYSKRIPGWEKHQRIMLDAIGRDSATKVEILAWARNAVPLELCRRMEMAEEYKRRILASGGHGVKRYDNGEYVWYHGRPQTLSGIPVIVGPPPANVRRQRRAMNRSIQADFDVRDRFVGLGGHFRGGFSGQRAGPSRGRFSAEYGMNRGDYSFY